VCTSLVDVYKVCWETLIEMSWILDAVILIILFLVVIFLSLFVVFFLVVVLEIKLLD
jgi:hypothetical protein